MGLGQIGQQVGNHIGRPDPHAGQHVGCLADLGHELAVGDPQGLTVAVAVGDKAHGDRIRIDGRSFTDQFIGAFLGHPLGQRHLFDGFDVCQIANRKCFLADAARTTHPDHLLCANPEYTRH
jgi:hypothetical protein